MKAMRDVVKATQTLPSRRPMQNFRAVGRAEFMAGLWAAYKLWRSVEEQGRVIRWDLLS